MRSSTRKLYLSFLLVGLKGLTSVITNLPIAAQSIH